jgi:hypothetical protein
MKNGWWQCAATDAPAARQRRARPPCPAATEGFHTVRDHASRVVWNPSAMPRRRPSPVGGDDRPRRPEGARVRWAHPVTRPGVVGITATAERRGHAAPTRRARPRSAVPRRAARRPARPRAPLLTAAPPAARPSLSPRPPPRPPPPPAPLSAGAPPARSSEPRAAPRSRSRPRPARCRRRSCRAARRASGTPTTPARAGRAGSARGGGFRRCCRRPRGSGLWRSRSSGRSMVQSSRRSRVPGA